jgi:hypothetical protein
MSAIEYATRWFTLQGLGCFEHPKEASKVREVVVVTHTLFLQSFFGAGEIRQDCKVTRIENLIQIFMPLISLRLR